MFSYSQNYTTKQSGEIYKLAGVKKVIWKYIYLDRKVFVNELDSDGIIIRHYANLKENGPMAYYEVFHFDALKRLDRIMHISIPDPEVPVAVRTSVQDTSYTYFYFDKENRVIRKEMYQKGVQTYVSIMKYDPDEEVSVYATGLKDSMVLRTTYYEPFIKKQVSTKYYGRYSGHPDNQTNYFYKYKSGRIFREVIKTKFDKMNGKKIKSQTCVNFYNYFSNGLLKNVESRSGPYAMMFKYEYF